MNKALLTELLGLTPAERIQLAEDLWDSIEPEELPPPTQVQQCEIERRIAEHAREPSRASSWDDVRARLWARFG
jgi:putative addiction module component (TIGR02574 family)